MKSKLRLLVTQVRARLKLWRDLLGIEPDWDIHVKIYYDKTKLPESIDTDFAEILVNEDAFYAEMSIFACNFDSKDLDVVIAHELIHIILAVPRTVVKAAANPAYEETADTIIEVPTERLARAIVRAYRAKPPKAKKRNVL